VERTPWAGQWSVAELDLGAGVSVNHFVSVPWLGLFLLQLFDLTLHRTEGESKS
jgi:hypothetical protein